MKWRIVFTMELSQEVEASDGEEATRLARDNAVKAFVSGGCVMQLVKIEGKPIEETDPGGG